MDPWKILGIEKEASKDAIQRAYREKVRKHHPDLGGDDWAFHQVQQAYEALTNPESVNKNTLRKQPKPQQTAPRDFTGTRKKQDSQTGNAQRKKYKQPPQTSTTYRQTHEREKPVRNPEIQAEGVGWNKWKNFFVGHLPLRTETTTFILVNVLDIFMTNKLLQFNNAREANPIAAYFIDRWGFNGAIVLKLGIVAFVCVIAQIVAMKKLKTAQALLIGGTVVVSGVVAYSIWLYVKHFA